uniref:Glycine rich superfamily member n=1 Tax=Rhipicephalus zambeziensis TaxID=60191 RepID=A0A224YJ78_9ACAR
MRSAVVIILVIALTILLFEEALSRISRPKLKTKFKRTKISKPKLKTTRTKHTRHKVLGKSKTAKKPGAGAAATHKHHGFGSGTGLYATQVGVEAVSSLGTTGTNIAQTVLQSKENGAENTGNGQGEGDAEETS